MSDDHHATLAATRELVSLHGDSPGLIADRYRVLEELGRGAMGVVFRVVDTQLDEQCALKMLLPARASEPRAALRLRREVKLARRVADAAARRCALRASR